MRKTNAPLIDIVGGLNTGSRITDGLNIWNAPQLSAILLQDMPHQGSLLYSTRVRANGATIIEPVSRADMLRFATVYCLIPDDNSGNPSTPAP